MHFSNADFTKSLFLSLIVLLIMTGCTQEPGQAKPNIVFIFADDFTYQGIRALGNPEIQTPSLDRLIDQGTAFTHAYNMGAWNGAVCVASRAMMMSGRFVWRAQTQSSKWNQGNGVEESWGKLMESAGYDTYMSGKWHIQAKANAVFQNVAHVRPGMPPDYWPAAEVGKKLSQIENPTIEDLNAILPIGYGRPKDELDHSWSPYDTSFGGFWKGGKHWSEVLKDDALTFIGEASKNQNPFFMYLAFNASHDPRQAPKKYIDQYPLENIVLPPNWQPEYPYKDGIGCGWSLRDEALAPFPRTEYATKVHRQEYNAIISHMDVQIGEIIKSLEATGKMDNTYIFFTADHGLAVGSHGLLGKQNMYDHSIRVPLFVIGPDIPKGKKNKTEIYLQDIMASCLELAEVPVPEYVEFSSFLDHAKGKTTEPIYESIYGAYINHQRMIRKDGYKLMVYPKIEKVRLFNLEEDPYEMNDLAADENQQQRIIQLFEELVSLQTGMEDTLDLKPLLEKMK
jgi:arylsulfatase A-like enzyme